MNTRRPETAGAAAVFLDRDGTIMRDVNYCGDPAQVEPLPGAREALLRLRRAGFKLIGITNQSGIGRGYFSEADYRQVEAELARQLGDAALDATYFCPDHPDRATHRRKPGIGMVTEAVNDYHIDLERSFFVGDKEIDAECGRSAGVRTVLVQADGAPSSQAAADWVVRGLREAADIILDHAH